MLWDRCPFLSAPSVCNVGVLWPNSWMDQDATWYRGRPRPRWHCVRGVIYIFKTGLILSDENSDNLTQLPSWKGAQPPPHFSAHICCGQVAGWIRIPLGMEVGLVPADIVLDVDPVTLWGTAPPLFGPCLLWPNSHPSQQLLSSCWISCQLLIHLYWCLKKECWGVICIFKTGLILSDEKSDNLTFFISETSWQAKADAGKARCRQFLK